MSVLMTGDQWKKFYSSADWDERWWHEEESIYANGKLLDSMNYGEVEDKDLIKVDGGFIYKDPDSMADFEYFEKFAKQWLKKQTQTSFLVIADKAIAEQVKSAVRQAGGRIK